MHTPMWKGHWEKKYPQSFTFAMNRASAFTVSTSLGDALIDMYIKTFNDARKILEAPGLISTYLVFSFQYYEFSEDLFPGYFFSLSDPST